MPILFHQQHVERRFSSLLRLVGEVQALSRNQELVQPAWIGQMSSDLLTIYLRNHNEPVGAGHEVAFDLRLCQFQLSTPQSFYLRKPNPMRMTGLRMLHQSTMGRIFV